MYDEPAEIAFGDKRRGDSINRGDEDSLRCGDKHDRGDPACGTGRRGEISPSPFLGLIPCAGEPPTIVLTFASLPASTENLRPDNGERRIAGEPGLPETEALRVTKRAPDPLPDRFKSSLGLR